MGAASAVLLQSGSEASHNSALTLAAGKSSIGHTEPAAGMAGVLHALQALQSQSVDAILHFRQVFQLQPMCPYLLVSSLLSSGNVNPLAADSVPCSSIAFPCYVGILALCEQLLGQGLCVTKLGV